jgi:hypothetical protein
VRLIVNFTLFLHSVPVISANSAKMPPKKKQRVDGLPSSRPVRQRLSTYSRPVDTTCLTEPVTNVVTVTSAQQHSDLSSSVNTGIDYPKLAAEIIKQ